MPDKKDRLPLSYAPITMGLAVRWDGVTIGLALKSDHTEWWTPYSVRGYPLAPCKTALDAAKALKVEMNLALSPKPKH